MITQGGEVVNNFFLYFFGILKYNGGEPRKHTLKH